VVEWHDARVATRRGLSGVPELLPRLPRFRGLSETERVLALVTALGARPRAAALTRSLGVAAGVWVPGFDLQLNNLLGESDIAYGEPKRGDHLESRMAPSLAFDGEGLAPAIGG